MSTKNESFNATVFSKEQFNVGLRFPLPSLFKQFLHFTKILLAFLHSNAVRVLMGCSILDMLFHNLPTIWRETQFLAIKKLSLKNQ